MPPSPTNVVIIGAGVIGLTFAHVLTEGESSKLFNVTIMAREMPEDLTSQAFASPWAVSHHILLLGDLTKSLQGANWSPMQNDERQLRWEKYTLYVGKVFPESCLLFLVLSSDKFWSMIPTGLVMVCYLAHPSIFSCE